MIFSRKKTEVKSIGRAAIGVLYDRHAPWLLAICLRYTGNRQDAEDVLHDGFMKIIRNIDRLEGKDIEKLKAWMGRIIVNTALNHIRDHAKEKMIVDLVPILESVQLADDGQEDNIFGGLDLSRDQLMEMICELPTGYRTVFNLYVMEDYSHKEIAELLQCSENTSKSQLSKARTFLRKRLFEYQKQSDYEQTATSNR